MIALLFTRNLSGGEIVLHLAVLLIGGYIAFRLLGIVGGFCVRAWNKIKKPLLFIIIAYFIISTMHYWR